MTLTDTDLARWRLRSQHLVGDGLGSATDVVRHHLCVQAENAAQSAWAVAARTRTPDPADLDAALADGRVLRTHVLRPTWHYAAAEDLPWLLDVTGPGIWPIFERQLSDLHGLGPAGLDILGAVVAERLAGGQHLARPALAQELADAGHALGGQALMMLLGALEVRGLVCSGAPDGATHTYALLAERVPEQRRLDRDEALAELARRYVAGHGPATVKDLAYWATLSPADSRAAMAAAADGLVSFEHDGRTYWHLPGEEPPTGPGEPLAHLLQILDETYRGFQDSRMVIDVAGVVPRGRETAIGMVLHDGQLVGSMKRSTSATTVTFDVVPYPSWTPQAAGDVDAAAAAYGAFLGLEPRVRSA